MPQKQPAATVQSCAPSGTEVAAPVPWGAMDILGDERPKERVKKRLTKDVKGIAAGEDKEEDEKKMENKKKKR